MLSSGTGGFTDDGVAVGTNQGNVFDLDTGTTSDYTDAVFNDGMVGRSGPGFSFTGTEAGFGEGTDDAFVAFGGDGDDFAVGINDADIFIGGKGRDTAVFEQGFKDYTLNWRLLNR